jgi:hypothetical protein
VIRGAGKPWAYDESWVQAEALRLEHLPAVLIECGAEEPMTTTPLPWDWWSLPADVRVMRRAHGIVGAYTCLSARSRPGSYRLLTVHLNSGQWFDWGEGTFGPDVLSLVEHRLALTRTKAAWRLARVMGHAKPLPPEAIR